jgi:hypothetical protein
MRTDGHDEVNRCSSHLCKGDYKLGLIKKGFAWLIKSVDKENALTLNVKKEFVALRLSSLASAEELSRLLQIQRRTRGEKIYETMADNKEHGILSPGNRRASPTTDISYVLENVLKIML